MKRLAAFLLVLATVAAIPVSISLLNYPFSVINTYPCEDGQTCAHVVWDAGESIPATVTPRPEFKAPCDQTVTDFDDIHWQDEAIICIAAGQYRDSLAIHAEGVTIRGVGEVVLFGGRDKELPYCDQQSYSEPSGVLEVGIDTNGYDHLLIENLIIHGYGRNGGLYIDHGTDNSTFRDLHIYNNGHVITQDNGQLAPNGAGIRLNGRGITFERVRVHDNGQDQIQNYNGVSISDLTIRESWLYNGRRHPNHTNEAFNYCRHTDGVQIYDGGTVDNVLIERVFFSGLTQCIIMGESKSEFDTTVNDVVIRDVVCDQAAGIGIYSKHDESHNWLLERVTLYCGHGYTGDCLRINGRETTVIDSVVDGSRIVAKRGFTAESEGNCQDNIRVEDEHADVGRKVSLSYVRAGGPMRTDNDLGVLTAGCVGSLFTTAPDLSGTPSTPIPLPPPTSTPSSGGEECTKTIDPASFNWNSAQPGDVLCIPAGTYNTQIMINKDGTSSHPITVRGVGEVTLHGGRTVLLPECDSAAFGRNDADRAYGIHMGSNSHWVFENIDITGFGDTGIYLEDGAADNTFRNMTITNNGTGWDGPGVRFAGTGMLFEDIIVLDNAQDAFQSSPQAGHTALMIRNAMLGNSRPHSSHNKKSFNDCTHSDGLQSYDGHANGFVFENVEILGVTNGLILGDGSGADSINNFTFDNVYINAYENAIYCQIACHGFTLQNVTVYMPWMDTSHDVINLSGNNHTIRDSIFYGTSGRAVFSANDLAASGNCSWQLTNPPSGETRNPQFVDPPTQVGDLSYDVTAVDPCEGYQ